MKKVSILSIVFGLFLMAGAALGIHQSHANGGGEASYSIINVAYADASPSPVAAVAPAPALTPAPVPTDGAAAISTAESLYSAIKAGNWTLVAAFALMLLVYGLRTFLLPDLQNAAWLPWLAVAIGIVGSFATALALGDSIWQALLSGVMVGASSSGLWGLLGGLLPTPPDQASVIKS